VRAVPGQLCQRDFRHVGFEGESIVRHYCQNVGRAAESQERCQVEAEGNKSRPICPQRYAVQINLCHLTHGLKLDVHTLAFE
jgi:hypothetical protein